MERLRRTGEGRILWGGVILWGLVATEVFVLFILDKDMAAFMLGGVATEMIVGREGGIPLALEGGAPPWLVAQVSFTQDIAAVAVAYPAFLWILHRYHEADNWFMRRIRRIEATADKHQAYVHRWGPLGVFLFMLIPFAVNGPLSGAIVGRLAGIPTKFLYAPVLGATAAAALAWTYTYDFAKQYVDGADARIAPIASGMIIAVLLTWMLLSEWRERRTEVLRERGITGDDGTRRR